MSTYTSVVRFPRQQRATTQAAVTPGRLSRTPIHTATNSSPRYRSTSVVTPQSVSTVSRKPAASDISREDATISTKRPATPSPAISVTIRMLSTPLRKPHAAAPCFGPITRADA